MRNIDKIVESQYPPKQTNVLWFDTTTSELKIYMNGEWVHADGLDEIATDEDIDSITKEELDKRQYFTIETIEDETTLSWLMSQGASSSKSCTIQYSSDDGQTWHNVVSGYDDTGNIATGIPAGTKFIFRGNGPTGFYDSGADDIMGSFFNAGDHCYVYGNVMSLLYGDNFYDKTDIKDDYAFAYLFSDYAAEWRSDWVLSKEGCPLILPATTLTDGCYYSMFADCTSIITTPVLPAATLADYCYQQMFEDCVSLNIIVCLATDISATMATDDWLVSVSPTGTFFKAAGVNWSTGTSGIPSGWTVVEE